MREQLQEEVARLGFGLFGIAGPAEFERYPRVAGPPGEGGGRPHPRELWPGCRSVLVLGLHCPGEAFDALVRVGDSRRFIFYAEIMGHGLYRVRDWLAGKGFESRPAEDVSGKRAAVLAGLGHVGRNTLVAHPRYGSNLRFGVLLTDAELPADTPNDPFAPDLCLDCRRCEEVCPGGAISDYSVTFSRCMIPAAEGWLSDSGEKMQRARRIQGRGQHLEVECNLCQKVCPLNGVADG